MTESENVAAIDGLNPNKSPGSDGLTSEFYKDFKEQPSPIQAILIHRMEIS